jgi:hypothetical protein
LRFLKIVALTALALAVPIASSNAAGTFGATVSGTPNAFPSACKVATASVPVTCTVLLGTIADPADTAPDGTLAPASGVITKWRVNVGQFLWTSLTLTPRVFNLTNKYTALRTGTPRSIPVPGGTFTFPDRVAVTKGDILAVDAIVDGPQNAAPVLLTSTLGSASYIANSPSVPDGDSIPVMLGSPSNTKLMINADVEADADGDGYGDETQDKCPVRASTHDVCAPPVLSKPKFSKGVFSFTSDLTGKATTTLFRVAKGHKVGKKCKSKVIKGKKSCKLYTKFAQWNDDVVPGSNKISYSYKVGGKSLKRGSYRATIVVASPPNTATTKTVDFKIK